jgi:hypothetical protein
MGALRHFVGAVPHDTTAKSRAYSGHEVAIFALVTFVATFVVRALEKAT